MDDRPWIFKHLDEPAVRRLSAELGGSELHAVLMHVMRGRARRRTPKDLLAQYRADAFCAPAPTDLRESVAVDGHLLAAADAFEAIELSPVAPLGVSSAVAQTGQNRVLSALRMTEVVSDPTNVLALECARRLRVNHDTPVHLVTSQRVLRAQPVPKLPGHSQHFRIFVLASGAPEAKDHAFTVETFVLHIRTMLRALDRLEQHGYAFGARRVDILATSQRQALGDRIEEALGITTPANLLTSNPRTREPRTREPVKVVRTALEHPYYSGGLRYQIWVIAPDGSEVPLVDGGAFDWLAKLAANRRAVYIATGAGAQLIAWRFRKDGREDASASGVRQ